MNNRIVTKTTVQADPWVLLKEFTSARIALGRTGAAVPLTELLNFKLAHAHAKDAVFSSLDKSLLSASMQKIGLEVYYTESKAKNRNEYLQRPDFGRRLSETSAQQLKEISKKGFDISVIIADGLSASAVNQHAVPLLSLLIPQLQSESLTVAPIVLVEQGRVAIADEIGSLLQARLSLILIGERPGLSSPDSMGAYLTYRPKPGLTDESRNCISNIYPSGLSYMEAAQKIIYLIRASIRLQLTGVKLKDEYGLI